MSAASGTGWSTGRGRRLGRFFRRARHRRRAVDHGNLQRCAAAGACGGQLDPGARFERAASAGEFICNSIDHALLLLGAMHAGIPVATISPAYSLISTDGLKLRAMTGLLDPGLIYVADEGQFATALGRLEGTGPRSSPAAFRRKIVRAPCPSSACLVRRTRTLRSMLPSRRSAPTASPAFSSPPARPARPRRSSTPTGC